MRMLLVLCCLSSAAVHAVLAPEHLRERPLLGAGFAAAAALLLLAAVAVVRGSTRVLLPTAWLLIALVAAYAAVLPFEGEPVTRLALATKAIELVGVGAALTAAGRRVAPRS